jgi:hypothetical protein
MGLLLQQKLDLLNSNGTKEKEKQIEITTSRLPVTKRVSKLPLPKKVIQKSIQ